jgi:hypothetical protein
MVDTRRCDLLIIWGVLLQSHQGGNRFLDHTLCQEEQFHLWVHRKALERKDTLLGSAELRRLLTAGVVVGSMFRLNLKTRKVSWFTTGVFRDISFVDLWGVIVTYHIFSFNKNEILSFPHRWLQSGRMLREDTSANRFVRIGRRTPCRPFSCETYVVRHLTRLHWYVSLPGSCPW